MEQVACDIPVIGVIHGCAKELHVTRTLKITKSEDGRFCVDDPSVPGSPPVGYGNTVVSAIGSWVINNQNSLDLKFDTTEVSNTEASRRQRELFKR